MGKSQETFSKKEKEKKKRRKKEEKRARREERKANNNKGASLEDMMAYIDEDGNITDTPPDPKAKKKVKAENIVLGVPKKEVSDEPEVHEGVINHFNQAKGYGFIKDTDNGQSYFVHVNGLIDDVTMGNKVKFRIEPGPKGMVAVDVERI